MVMKIIVGGYVDAVVGVACLNVLEKAIDKVLLAGIPCMAVPLLSSDCRKYQGRRALGRSDDSHALQACPKTDAQLRASDAFGQ